MIVNIFMETNILSFSSIYKCFNNVHLVKGKNDNIGNLCYIMANEPRVLVKVK